MTQKTLPFYLFLGFCLGVATSIFFLEKGARQSQRDHQLSQDFPSLSPPCPSITLLPVEKENASKPICTNLEDLRLGEWIQNRTWFEPRKCRLLHFDGQSAKKCLKDRTIAFIGDSTMASFWRQYRNYFSTGVIYRDTFDPSELKEKWNGETQHPMSNYTWTYYDPSSNTLLRNYALWRIEMWDSHFYKGSLDNLRFTTQSVLLNQTHDLILMSVAAHHLWEDARYFKFINTVGTFHNTTFHAGTAPPLLWISLNAQYAPKKPPKFKFQDVHESRVFNEYAKWTFKRRKLPLRVLDFSGMVEEGFPWSSRDGMHVLEVVDWMKWQILLTLLCGEEGIFDLKNLHGFEG